MSIKSELTRIETAKNNIIGVVRDKGIYVHDGVKLEELPQLTNSIMPFDYNNTVQIFNGSNLIKCSYSYYGGFTAAMNSITDNITKIICGNNVKHLDGTFSGCTNINCDFICGSNVTAIGACFSNSCIYGGRNHYYNNALNISDVTATYTGISGDRLNVFVNSNCLGLFLDNMFYVEDEWDDGDIMSVSDLEATSYSSEWEQGSDENGSYYCHPGYNTYVYSV